MSKLTEQQIPTGNSFLENTASYILEKYGEDISKLCIVFPNKRAGLFFKNHLSKGIKEAVWVPDLLDTEEFISQVSDYEIIDNTIQLFELYKVYEEHVEDPEVFEEFSKWGQSLLHDFNEIDRYLIPEKQLFNQINEARAIEVWNLEGEEITEFQQKYLKFWEQLGMLYQQFSAHLTNQNYAYQGMAFRKVAEQLVSQPEPFIASKLKWDKIIFVGFNALTKAEESIIAQLIKSDKAEILWDADEYYLEDQIQETGIFLRRYQKRDVFQPFNWIQNKFKTQQKTINILGIPQNIGQAKAITSILNEIDSANNYKDTAIVLSDENLLIPVLQSIPKEIEHINITMGYPLKHTPINNFFDIYLNTLVNAERFGHNKKLTYHYKDLLKLFRLPITQQLFGKETCDTLCEHIINNNLVFIDQEKLNVINDQLSDFSFRLTYSIPEIMADCLFFIESAKQYFNDNYEEGIALELEYLFHFAKLFNQFKTYTDTYPFIDSIKSFYSIYQQILNGYALDLYGEPLKGLQVMGMLETRNIEFDNLILLSANEGILPAGKTFNSFIPFDIKSEFNLPTHVEKDAIYAYHLYRLVQNANNIHILYNTETTDFGSSEQSRFVTQIEHELGSLDNIDIKKRIIKHPLIHAKAHDRIIEKSEAIHQQLLHLVEKGLSPTALNTYINCPLDFYYKYVLGIREIEEVEETIEHTTFGDYVHKVLELAYESYTIIGEKELNEIAKRIPDLTHKVFLNDFSEKEIHSGKNYLIYNVALNYLNTFIQNEIEWVQKNGEFEKMALEMELSHNINIGDKTVALKGKADRIDNAGDKLRIIDYKTGLTEKRELKLTNISELLESNKKNKPFQVLMYAYLFKMNVDELNLPITSGIVSFRKLSAGLMNLEYNKSDLITDELLEEFENLLSGIVNEMLDLSVSFTHREESKYCKFCQ